MNIIPLYDRIVLKRVEEKQEKIGNIILPESAQEKPQLMEVIALGTGGKLDGNDIDFKVKIGDKVLYNKFSGFEFSIQKETFILVKECDILAIVE